MASYPKCVDMQVKEGVVQSMVDLINQRSSQESSRTTPLSRVVLSALTTLTRLAKHERGEGGREGQGSVSLRGGRPPEGQLNGK